VTASDTVRIEPHHADVAVRRLTKRAFFPKRWENLHATVALHFGWYNFCRKHITLNGATPTMAAELADRPWTLVELLNTQERLGQAA
jgi:hypothetical protein